MDLLGMLFFDLSQIVDTDTIIFIAKLLVFPAVLSLMQSSALG